MSVRIDGNTLSLEDYRRVAEGKVRVELTAQSLARVAGCRQVLEEFLGGDKPHYGINTGFGALAQKEIASKDLRRLQRNLIRSHVAGVGPLLSERVVRGVMLLRANVLAKGYSGVRPEVVQLLLAMLNHGVIPCIPSQGSVGASGDLAPLAHLAQVLIGEGEATFQGKVLEGGKALKAAGLEPLELVEKEGLALINGTQMMTAIGVFNLLEAENLVKVADIAAALTFEAQLGNPSPFYDEIHQVRRHPGQAKTAANIRHLIKDSPLWISHQGKRKVQDAYSVRCTPQVHGAVRDTLAFVRRTLEIEVNSATENPLVFPEQKLILSGGNFHGEPIAFAMDFLAIALSEIGSISERRIDRLVNPASNMGLPPFLTAESGLNSGFMIAHVTASALASENKVLAHPASVDSIPTSANQEDHVSMGAHAARKGAEVVANVRHILAIEVVAALQALGFYELKTSPPLEGIRAAVRKKVPFITEDTRMDLPIREVAAMIESGALLAPLKKIAFPLQ